MRYKKCSECRNKVYADTSAPIPALCKKHYLLSLKINYTPGSDFLPQDCLFEISKYLDLQDYLNMLLVNKWSYTLFTNPLFWENEHYIHIFNTLYNNDIVWNIKRYLDVDSRYKYNNNDFMYEFAESTSKNILSGKSDDGYISNFYFIVSNYKDFNQLQKISKCKDIALMARKKNAYIKFYSYALKINLLREKKDGNSELIQKFNDIFFPKMSIEV